MSVRGKRIHVGTSGWVYKDWRGTFYPDKLPSKKWLAFYAEQFDTVEINGTFYRLASAKAAAAWNSTVPHGFRMVAKGSAFITHRLKLRNVEQAVQRFFEPLEPLTSLKVVLWQFPAVMPRDLERLEQFFERLPRHVRHAVEFREASWWADDVVALLKKHDITFCAVSHPALPSDIVPTNDMLYVRFHGLGPKLYDYDYNDAELTDWVTRLKKPLRGRELYAFFNNDWHARAIRNAKTFREMLTTPSR